MGDIGRRRRSVGVVGSGLDRAWEFGGGGNPYVTWGKLQCTYTTALGASTTRRQEPHIASNITALTWLAASRLWSLSQCLGIGSTGQPEVTVWMT